MSKFLFTLVLSILIVFISCAGDCYWKIPYKFDWDNTTYSDVNVNITDGTTKLAFHHANSCNSLSAYSIRGDLVDSNGNALYQDYCCYLHIKYKSNIDGNRYEKLGCINVNRPFEDYGGDKDNVKERVAEVKSDFESAIISASPDRKTLTNKPYVKIVCASSFLKFSTFALLAIILF